MKQLGLNQAQVAGITGKSKGSISMYLSGGTIPPQKVQGDIATSLGLAPDYFEQEDAQVAIMSRAAMTEGKIKRMLPEEAAFYLGMDKGTVRKGLQQGVFPWGYGIVTSIDPSTGKKHWAYFINARRFAEIEGVVI